jgi:hypothetical protein
MQECERNQIVYSETSKWERDRVVEILFRKGWGNDFFRLHYTFSSAPTPAINNDQSLN